MLPVRQRLARRWMKSSDVGRGLRQADLARLCGGVITGKDYVGYFLNEHGEELVFARGSRRGYVSC